MIVELRTSANNLELFVKLPILFNIGDNTFAVDEGFVSNGCSVPKIFWDLISPCIDQRTVKAAIVHDYLYSVHICTRKQADKVFLKLLILGEFPLLKAVFAYLAVRLFGSPHW